jgi:hypothetical protein
MTAWAISYRRTGVKRAFMSMFIRGAPEDLKCVNSSLPDLPRMDNPMNARSYSLSRSIEFTPHPERVCKSNRCPGGQRESSNPKERDTP